MQASLDTLILWWSQWSPCFKLHLIPDDLLIGKFSHTFCTLIVLSKGCKPQKIVYIKTLKHQCKNRIDIRWNCSLHFCSAWICLQIKEVKACYLFLFPPSGWGLPFCWCNLAGSLRSSESWESNSLPLQKFVSCLDREDVISQLLCKSLRTEHILYAACK